MDNQLLEILEKFFKENHSGKKKFSNGKIVTVKRSACTENTKYFLWDIKCSISDENMEMLNNELDDTEKNDENIYITSVLKKYDKDNSIVSVRVKILNETTGETTYKIYTI